MFDWVFPFERSSFSKVLILAEGGDGIGYGHITRNVGLIHYLRGFGMNPELVIRGENLKDIFFEDEKYVKCEWLRNERLFEDISCNTLVFVDSYHAGLDFYEEIYKKTEKLVIYDDFKRLNYTVGYIVNPVADEDFYGGYDKVLTGENYIFLRKSFLEVASEKMTGKIQNILVTLGGNPPEDMLKRVISVIKRKWKCAKIVAVCEPVERLDIYFTGFCNAETLVKYMNEADLAISAGGQTLHELHKMKVPTYMIQTADNQKNNVKYYEKKGFQYFGDKLKMCLCDEDIISYK